MPFRRSNYDFMLDDGLDTRVPVYSDEVFKHGIHFCCKFIGAMDVPRPQNRLEIVSSMRRIRYEFKAKGVKKLKVLIKVSAEGAFVYGRNKPKVGTRLSSAFSKISGSSTPIPIEIPISKITEESGTGGPQALHSSPSGQGGNEGGGLLGLGLRNASALSCVHPSNVIFVHPIYRIFYVSHDSQDLNIFSYIARDSKSSCFKCYVFKAYKKLQAMRIVRTVGQAFDVCHRLADHMQENDPNSKKMDEGQVGGAGDGFSISSPRRRKPMQRNHRSHSPPPCENSSDDNEWRAPQRRRHQKHRKNYSSTDDPAEIGQDDRVRSVNYSEEVSEEDSKKPAAPLTLKKVKKASSGRRRRHRRTSSDDGDASSDTSDIPRRHLRSHMKPSITNDDFLMCGQFGRRLNHPTSESLSFLGLPQSQSFDTNLARDILCESSTHSVQSQSSIPSDSALLSHLLSELQSSLANDHSVGKQQKSDSSLWVPYLGGRIGTLSETGNSLSRQLDILEANMIRACKTDLRSISSYQLSKEVSNSLGIPGSITTPNLVCMPTDTSNQEGEKAVHNGTTLSAETLGLLKRQLNIQETETKIAIYQIHRLMKQLRLEVVARIEGQHQIEQLLSQNRSLSEGYHELALRLKHIKNGSSMPSSTSEKKLHSASSPLNGVSSLTSPITPSRLPQSATFSALKSEGFSRLAELDAMVQNVVNSGLRPESLRRASSPGHTTQMQPCSSESPKLPSLSPFQSGRSGGVDNNTRFSSTDNSSSPCGSNSLSLPPPLQMPYRGSDGEDGFLELATRSSAMNEDKESGCNWVDKCFGMATEGPEGEGNNSKGTLFEPFGEQEEPSNDVPVPTPHARLPSILNVGNPWVINAGEMERTQNLGL